MKERHPEIPWTDMTGYRNVLVHAYMDIRLDRVWRTIVDDLPALKRFVEQELRDRGHEIE